VTRSLKRSVCGGIIILCLFLAASGCLQGIPGLTPPVTYPVIVPVKGGIMPPVPVYQFRFQDRSVTLTADINPEVYAGSREADKSARIYDDKIGQPEWLAGIYTAMISDPAQDDFYSNLLTRARMEKAKGALEDDEYLEYLAVFVQSIPYENLNLTDPKFPVETFADGEGDCDDKSMLLAGLLSREGYRVALLYFEPELHMAVGVDCGDSGYKNSGYGYIETTNTSYVGVEPGTLAGGVILESYPLVFPVGNGTKTYTICNETREINELLESTRQELTAMEPEIELTDQRLETMKTGIEETEREMAALLSGGRVREYNRMVTDYNEKVSTYNTLLHSYRDMVADYNRRAELCNYILTHAYDRKGTYEWIRSRYPPESAPVTT
jgi:flagellar biosynthesis chaperone FliJ